MPFDFRQYIIDNCDPKFQVSKPDEAAISCINPDCLDNSKRKRKMAVNVAKKVAHCHLCGKNYKLLSFVATVEGIPFIEAVKMIKEDDPPRTIWGENPLEIALSKLHEDADEKKPFVFDPIWPLTFPIAPKSAPGRYLEQRKFNQAVIDHFQLAWCPIGPCSGRIIIPVHDHLGKKVTFQARTIHDVAPKYWFPPGSPNLLYNWHHAKAFEEVVLVEGVTDCWRVWLSGRHNVAATFGKNLKSEQRRVILDSGVKKILFFWDGNAIPEAWAAAAELFPQIKVDIVELPYNQEPDNCACMDTAIAWRKEFKEETSPLEIALKRLSKPSK